MNATTIPYAHLTPNGKAERLSNSRCQCAGCEQVFGATSTFDKHRRGGRCLSPDEMRGRGMTQDDIGVWRGAGGWPGVDSQEPTERGASDRVRRHLSGSGTLTPASP